MNLKIFMLKEKVNKQINHLYAITGVGYFKIASASWVALLAMRGFSILEIGILESIFHVVSLVCEIPSGAVADVYGRKKTMIASLVVTLVSSILMIASNSFWTTALAIGTSALSYNLSSGTREALAYDSLKRAGREEEYTHFASTEMMLYRIVNSTATLCAGLALWLGYRKAYSIDIVITLIALYFALTLYEVPANEHVVQDSIREQFATCIRESLGFLVRNKKARWIILFNAAIGAIATLMLFFLQAKLPLAGLPASLLGPALFIMGLGAALGSKLVGKFSDKRYSAICVVSIIGITLAVISLVIGKPYLMCIGGFVAAFSDDFLEVRTDIVLNNMIPSEQRATLVSVCSWVFSLVMIFLSTFMGWIMD